MNFDDQVYVYENPEVVRGLTLHGIVWALHVHCSNWHPLTWISHMLDCQMYGLQAGGHHLTNVLLHTATVILLFLVLRRMTGFLWRSAFVAAVFAVHPLRVESVAWVAERKDVLSGVFFMLTLWAYVQYVEKSKVQSPKSERIYGLVLLFFGLGLMCKPMLVTLPFVLLLLDYWPLGRVSGADSRVTSQISDLLLEKLPLFGLVSASCAITIYAQTDAIQSFEQISLPLRVGNALISYVAYLGQMFWPAGLAVLYPFAAGSVGVSGVVLSLVLLAGISTGAFVLRRQWPYFLTGWLWYLIMLVPVIGIVQVGVQARADRYTYLPQIGLYLLLTWAAADLCAGWRHRRVVLGGGATIILVALIFCARGQTSYWRNSESLWTHTLACTSDNAMAQNLLGNALIKKGSADEAASHCQMALQIKPDYVDAHINLGDALLQKGKVDEAIVHFQKALQIKPGYVEVHNNLGSALLQKGNVDEAISQYQKALQIRPGYAEACNNLGVILLQKGKVDEAISHCQKALQINPDYADAHINLGNALLQKGSVDEAITHYQRALQIQPDSASANNNLNFALLLKGKVDEAITCGQKALQTNPDSPEALNNLAWLLATCPDAHLRDGVQAVKYAERACELTQNSMTLSVGTLAAAYAEAGRFDDAINAAQKACALASAAGERDLLQTNRKLLALYRAHQPYHETAEKFVSAAP